MTGAAVDRRAPARCALVRLLVVSLAAVAFCALASPARADPAAPADDPAAQQLVDRYAPVVVVRRYDTLCGTEGEPYVPMTVEALLGNPEVALRQVGNGDQVITWGPTARDLYSRGQGVYLDLAGDALKPGCIFATDSARYNAGGKSAVYAHIARQADKPGYLAVQYWLYWYYNDWNDKHESDWEFTQVLFKADSVDEALRTDPVSVGYAQHTGGEVSEWTSDKLEREDTHFVVYSSQGSHASYIEPALYLGRSASEGFGCDNTQTPSTRLHPKVVLLPDEPSGPDDPFAWLDFQGRWGEREGPPNDGPTGPAMKPRWSAPIDWQSDLRPSAFVVPGGSAAAPDIVSSFCDVVERASLLFIDFRASPSKVIAVLLLLGTLLWLLIRRTSWRAVPPLPVVSRRRAGEIVRAAMQLYRRRPVTFLALGLHVVPVAILAALVSAVLVHLPGIGDATTVAEEGDPGGTVLIAAAVAALFLPLSIVVVSAPVAWLLAASEGEAVPGARKAVVAQQARRRQLASSFFPAVLVIGLLSLTVVGLPFAVWLTVRYQFLSQVTMIEGTSGRRTLARSGALVHGRWLHTGFIAAVTWATVQGLSVFVGLLLLILLTGLPLWAITAAEVLCQIALMPLGAMILTLLYGDARASEV